MGTQVTDLPKIMAAKGWLKGKALMDRWFSLPANDKPAAGKPDTSTIKMEWVLSFNRAKNVYDDALKDRIWVNGNAQREIVKMLHRSKLLLAAKTDTPFGSLTRPIDAIDRDYVQYRAVTETKLDDLGAALGKFVFRFAVEGKVSPESAGLRTITIEKVGVYVWDSYDFNGTQVLGFWDKDDNSVSDSVWGFGSGSLIDNESFRDWRKANSKGGDFYVYSDVKQLKAADGFKVRRIGSSYQVDGLSAPFAP